MDTNNQQKPNFIPLLVIVFVPIAFLSYAIHSCSSKKTPEEIAYENKLLNCSPNKLPETIKKSCCQQSFLTGLYDEDALLYCSIKTIAQLNCDQSSVEKMSGSIQCINSGKRFPENPCSDLTLASNIETCNNRREELIRLNIAKAISKQQQQ